MADGWHRYAMHLFSQLTRGVVRYADSTSRYPLSSFRDAQLCGVASIFHEHPPLEIGANSALSAA
jgi:hypothetical protein